MKEKLLKQIADEIFSFLNNKGVSFVCIFWRNDIDITGGSVSADVDIGDACVVIERIVKHFNIDPQALYQAIIQVKTDMDNN